MTLKGIDGRWFADVVAATEVISLLDADDRVLYVSLSIDGDYLGQPVFNFVDPGYHASLRDSLAGARATGLPHHFSSSAAGIEGDTHRSNWVVALGGDAGAGMVAVIATDISHTARVEAQLLARIIHK